MDDYEADVKVGRAFFKCVTFADFFDALFSEQYKFTYNYGEKE